MNITKAKRYVFATQDHNKIKKNDVGLSASEKSGVLKIQFIRGNITLEVQKNLVKEFSISETGDRFEYKICDRCFQYLPTTECFSKNRKKKGDQDTRRPSCKVCRKKKDGIKIVTSNLVIWEKKKPEKYAIFSCPICKKQSIVGLTSTEDSVAQKGKMGVVLDHNHETGKVRGYICESCNTGIGRFDDKVQILENAIKWLKENN